MGLIGVGAFAPLQVLDVRLVVPLELRTQKRGYDGIRVPFIGETAAGRVVHLCHEPTFVTRPLATDLAIRLAVGAGRRSPRAPHRVQMATVPHTVLGDRSTSGVVAGP